ncbi:hypothetical protein, partial [Brucella cytisi]|uniref:hypothetical protein n=1 Tax=Brucella cytisi TaxID=407152 RepID=UPI00197FB70A
APHAVSVWRCNPRQWCAAPLSSPGPGVAGLRPPVAPLTRLSAFLHHYRTIIASYTHYIRIIIAPR